MVIEQVKQLGSNMFGLTAFRWGYTELKKINPDMPNYPKIGLAALALYGELLCPATVRLAREQKITTKLTALATSLRDISALALPVAIACIAYKSTNDTTTAVSALATSKLLLNGAIHLEIRHGYTRGLIAPGAQQSGYQ